MFFLTPGPLSMSNVGSGFYKLKPRIDTKTQEHDTDPYQDGEPDQDSYIGQELNPCTYQIQEPDPNHGGEPDPNPY